MNILKFLKPKACVDFVYDDNTARQALEKMKNHSFTAVPVIDREGRYVKTLAEGDFLWFMLNNGALLSRLSYIFPAHAYPECHY